MKRNNKCRLALLAFIGIFLLCMGMQTTVLAIPSNLTSSTGSLILQGNEDVSIAGVEFTAYQVGDLVYEDGKTFALTDDFADAKVSLDSLEGVPASEFKAAIETLQTYVDTNKINGTTTTANDSGTATFSNLPVGVYLVVQSSNNSSVIVSSALVAVPTYTNGAFVYDVQIEPKAETAPDGGVGRIRVTKNVYFEDMLLTADEAADQDMAVFHVALFSDEAATQMVSEIKTIDFRGESAEVVIFENLAVGNYYVVEVNETGTPIASIEGNPYTPSIDNNGLVAVTRDTTSDVTLKNTFTEQPTGYYDPETTTTAPEESSGETLITEPDLTTEAPESSYPDGYIIDPTTTGSNSESSDSTIIYDDDDNNNSTTTNGTGTRAHNVYTGDQIRNAVIWLVVIVIAIAAIIIVLRKKKHKK